MLREEEPISREPQYRAPIDETPRFRIPEISPTSITPPKQVEPIISPTGIQKPVERAPEPIIAPIELPKAPETKVKGISSILPFLLFLCLFKGGLGKNKECGCNYNNNFNCPRF